VIANLQFILVPLLTGILLLAITSYFGIHVLKREIIFIDIALAQIAILGSAVAVYLEHTFQTGAVMVGKLDISGWIPYLLSLLFCLGAAILFTLLKDQRIRIPIEAFIGIAYAFATTAAVIILDKGAGADVHLHDMLTGALLWTTWSQLLRLAGVCLVIAIFHVAFRRKFIRLSDHYLNSWETHRGQKWWDFLFYFTFSIVIIEAVRIAGVLTVFAFLILPASISALFSNRWGARIWIGLGAGVVATLLGLHFSITYDLTVSPLIILFLGVILLLGLMIRSIAIRSRTKRA
jgi:zinc/manganese transport system permease protein